VIGVRADARLIPDPENLLAALERELESLAALRPSGSQARRPRRNLA
jgi:hypothetical protein